MRDPARVARDRLLRLERQAKARAEAAAVAGGVAETVALSRARGSAIAEPAATRSRVCAQLPCRLLRARVTTDSSSLSFFAE